MALTKATYSMIDGAPVNIKDFGVVGDGSDETTAIQSFFTYIKTNNRKGYIPKPASFYGTTSTISLTNCRGIVIECETAVDRIEQQSYFKRLSGTSAMFDFEGASQLVLRNFSVDGNSLATKGLILKGNASNRVTHCTFDNLNVVNCTTYGLEIGEVSAFQWDAAVFNNCWISSNAIGIYIEGGNTEQVNFVGGSIAGATTYGVKMSNAGANFYGTQFLNCAVADIFIDSPLQHDLTVVNPYSEGGAIFLLTTSTSSVSKRCINIFGGQLLSVTSVNTGLGARDAVIYHRNNMGITAIGVKGAGGLASDFLVAPYGTYSIVSQGNEWANESLNVSAAANGVKVCQIDNQNYRFVGLNQYTVQEPADTGIDADLSGGTFNNNTATGGVTYSLPAAVVGLKFTFVNVSGAYYVRVDPNGTNQIRGGGAGKYLSLDSDGSNVTLQCVIATIWEIVSVYGTTSYQP
jgi:hypothetical protein